LQQAQAIVSRALREAQQGTTGPDAAPTFRILHELDERGEPVAVPRGTVPSMHSFRHTMASRALLAGESVDEIAFLLCHRDANVTRAVYVGRRCAPAVHAALADDGRVWRRIARCPRADGEADW
jgi:integrase